MTTWTAEVSLQAGSQTLVEKRFLGAISGQESTMKQPSFSRSHSPPSEKGTNPWIFAKRIPPEVWTRQSRKINSEKTVNASAKLPGFKVRWISASALEGFLTEHSVRVQIT